MSTPYNTAAQARYSTGAIVLHWLLALAIVGNWLLAQYAERLEDQKLEAQHEAAMGVHFALGLTVLLLTAVRLGWRLVHKAPPVSAAYRPWERLLARVVHKLFYVLMVALPFTGYMILQTYAGGMSIDMFGLFDFPGWTMAKNEATTEVFAELHEVFGTTMLVLFLLHVAGALKHQLMDRDATMARMLPFLRRS